MVKPSRLAAARRSAAHCFLFLPQDRRELRLHVGAGERAGG